MQAKTMEEPFESLIAQMTIEEKIAMLAGADLWHTVPIERLGIPAMRVTDGPIGARGTQARGGPTSACFPAPIALAATWNPKLVERVGMALGNETKAKGAHILLAPTVNIHRSPLAGRHFECYSEDPYLTARMAVAYIKGLQSQGVGACIKHFVCNDSEFQRHTISSEVGERPLHEIYLAPFRAAVREANPWAVMSAYNKLNGVWCSENRHLLLEVLKEEWGFDGIVISDWFGTYTPNVAAGGLDLEMPGPARWMGQHVQGAMEAGDLSLEELDDKVRRLLRTLWRVGAFDQPELRPEQAIDRPEDRRLAREVAAEAIVLLKNQDRLLPLDLGALKSIAVIGENARWAQVQGGGSAHVSPHHVVSPLDGILTKAAGRATVGYEIGCPIHKRLPLIDVNLLTAEDGSQGGLTVQFFANPGLSGSPVYTERYGHADLVWLGESVPGIDPERFSARLAARFTPAETGRHVLGLMSVGRSRLLVDGQEIIDHWTETPSGERPERVAEIDLVAGQSVQIVVEYSWQAGSGWRMLRLGCLPPMPSDPVGRAVELAARSDVAIVFAGLTDEWESEGEDRAGMDLPGDQVALIERVAAANPRTIVVLNTGSPIPMDWLDAVPAVVQAWYPGQEAGHAIADVLFGDANPSGRLPTTFPRCLKDNPAYLNYPGENGKVTYGEGLFVGYRYYDAKGIEPLFPFGYGLSYTTFAYSNLRLEANEYLAGDEIRVRVDVENTGARAGQEVVQLYLRDVESALRRPEKELKAFAKVALEPGETKTVTLLLDQEALSYYDPDQNGWVVEPGEFEVLVGSSSRDIRLAERFTLRTKLDSTLG
jgi:beta-glucosidase